ncbi:hypothetical protein TPA0910_70330 [Streptomyces hygroscopicus subsp. sporocinereus]|uniref:Uncharacterized protein n=1 Tax=Streptomyces hygroscopicus TaxID=1912 RepID=A0ABQ3UAH2_STRHY|nr:hypothetical protein TPA0910_70330 [Streptomyces hygroscopicus]
MSVVIGTPAGSPSSVATSAGPCDSPAVSQRNLLNGAPSCASLDVVRRGPVRATPARTFRSSHERGSSRLVVHGMDRSPGGGGEAGAGR